jgi:DNA-binding response OmpR family regulator
MTAFRELSQASNPRLVLVVDDDADLRTAIADALVQEGFQVLMAGDGHQAVTLALRHRPDLLLLDFRMPNGLGTDVLKILRRSGLPTTAILMTAAENVDELFPRLGFEPEDVLMKPFGLELLVSMVDAAIPRSRRA